MEGRSSDEIRRTLSIVSSTRLIISFSWVRVLAGGRGLLCNQERSSFRAVKAWPNSSWISRAIRILSSSRTASRRAAKPRSCSPDVRRDSSARLFSEISRITSVVVVVATTLLSPVRLKVCGEPKLNWYHLFPVTPHATNLADAPLPQPEGGIEAAADLWPFGIWNIFENVRPQHRRNGISPQRFIEQRDLTLSINGHDRVRRVVDEGIPVREGFLKQLLLLLDVIQIHHCQAV